MARIRRMLVTLGAIYLLLLLVVTVLQRSLLFFPTMESERVMLANAAMLGLEPWRNPSGDIIGWNARTKPGTPAAHKLLVFHGNAGHAQHRGDYVRAFESIGDGKQWQVWIFEYPGYGARTGSPSRKTFRTAARAAIAHLHAADARPLFLLGESLGVGVAGDLAGEERNAISGLILVTPFTRLTDVAQSHFPFLPARLFVRDRWDNHAALSSYHGPVAVLIAGRDEVVGSAQGEMLFEKLPARKRRWLFPDATHNDAEIQRGDWASEVADFLIAPADSKR